MQENKHAERAHAKHSPSSLKHKKLCPKWENESRDTVFTDDGTKCHEAVETGDLSKLTELQHYYANCAVKYAQPIIDGASRVLKEERLWNAEPAMRDLTHGSPDLMAWAGETHLDIVDYKFGRLPVDPAKDNLQAKAYVLAAFDTYPEVETITFHFVHPRLADHDSNHTFHRRDRTVLCYEILFIVSKAEDPKVKPTPETEACLYCKNRGCCPALLTEMIRYSHQMHLNEIPDFNLDLNVPENRAKLFEVLKTLAKAVPQAQEELTTKHLNGDEIPGYELKFRRGARSVVDTAKAYAAVEDIVTPEEFLKVCSVSISDLEEVVVGKATDTRAAKANLNSVLEASGALVIKPETKYLTKIK
jgi:hypothetical protein